MTRDELRSIFGWTPPLNPLVEAMMGSTLITMRRLEDIYNFTYNNTMHALMEGQSLPQPNRAQTTEEYNRWLQGFTEAKQDFAKAVFKAKTQRGDQTLTMEPQDAYTLAYNEQQSRHNNRQLDLQEKDAPFTTEAYRGEWLKGMNDAKADILKLVFRYWNDGWKAF